MSTTEPWPRSPNMYEVRPAIMERALPAALYGPRSAVEACVQSLLSIPMYTAVADDIKLERVFPALWSASNPTSSHSLCNGSITFASAAEIPKNSASNNSTPLMKLPLRGEIPR